MTKQRRQNRGFSAESAVRRGRGTINRYGQLESTSRVQFVAPRQRMARWTRILAGGDEWWWKRDRETKSRRGKRKGERDCPDIHHTLFFILHYPCSTPLYSIMPAPCINDESYPRPRPSRREPPYVHQVTRRPCTSLCATTINTSPCTAARLSNEKSTLLYADRFIIRIKLRPSVSFDQFEVNFSFVKLGHNYECCLVLTIKNFDETKFLYKNYNRARIITRDE